MSGPGGDQPYLSFFPYLPTFTTTHSDGRVTFGEWELGPVDAFEGRWLSQEFEDLCKAFIRSFRSPSGQRLRNPSVLADRTRGLDGSLPHDRQRLAIQLAIEFGYLDQRPTATEPNAASMTLTTDNTELVIWPIDLHEGRVTQSSGLVVKRVDGGYRISDDLAIGSPIELVIPVLGPRNPDTALLDSIYGVAMGAADQTDAELARRLVTAVGWLSKAWRNSSSIGWDDRIVLLKTGFEALTAKSDTYQCASWLRYLYEHVLGGADPATIGHLLWSPTEAPRRRSLVDKTGNTRHRTTITELEQWFIQFGWMRNQVIHDGTYPSLSLALGTRYDGEVFFVAERLLRETIRVALGNLGYPDMWKSHDRRDHEALVAGLVAEGLLGSITQPDGTTAT